MPAYRSENSSKWYCSFYYRDWTGKNVKKLKRGFKTKREALDWERHFLMQQAADLNMTFSDFWKLYERDQKPKLRESTWESKEYMVQKKILPYFGEKKMCEITARDVIQWQNEMRQAHTAKGEGYSETYLKSLHAQLSCIFNHAVRFYELKCNPARKAGAMGYGEAEEMLFWTKEEYLQFIPYVADKAQSYMAFELLYWCGIRMGELLALTKKDFDFSKNILSITKSYQRIKGKDVITKPKTRKSFRKIVMPAMVANEMKVFIDSIYGLKNTDRIFTMSKSGLHHEMDRGTKLSGVKRIRIHDLRHSHVSLLINMGFSAVAIGNRVGHESEKITFRYAHMFPSIQTEMAMKLDEEWEDGFDVTERVG